MYHRISRLFKSFNRDDDEHYEDDDGTLDEPESDVDRFRGQITDAVGDPEQAEKWIAKSPRQTTY